MFSADFARREVAIVQFVGTLTAWVDYLSENV